MPSGNVVAKAWVEIIPEMSGIRSEISDELKGVDKQTAKAGKSAGSGFSSAFKGAVAAVGGLVAAAGIGELVSQAAETQSVMSRLSASADQNGVSAQSMEAAYGGLVGVLGDSERAVETAGNMFAMCGDNQAELETLTTSLTGAFSQFGDGMPIESLAEAANETANCGVVVGSFADALNWVNASTEQWSAALGGNDAALQAFNAAVDSGMSKEDAFNEALKTCSDEGERNQLVIGTLNALYGEAGAKYEQANANLIAYNKSQDALSSGMAGLGSALMPVLTGLQNLAATAMSAVAPAIESVVAQVSEAGSRIRQALQTAISGGGTGGFAFELTNLFNGLYTAISEGMQKLAAAFPTIMQTVMPIVTTAVTTYLTTWFQNLPSLLMSFLGMVVSGVSSFVSSLAAQLPTMLPTLVASLLGMINNLMSSVFSDLPTYIGQLIDAAVQLFQGIADAIPQVIPVVVQGIGTLVRNVLNNLPAFLGQMINAAVTLFTGIVSAIPQIVPAVLNGISSLLQSVWDSITGFDLVGAGRDLIQGLIDGIGAMAGSVIDAIGGVVGGAIDWAKGLLGIASPSKLFREFGLYTMEGFALGFSDGESYPVRAMGDVVDSIRREADVSARFSAELASMPSAEQPFDSGAGRGVSQTFVFNQPIDSPYEVARACRLAERRGLAACV